MTAYFGPLQRQDNMRWDYTRRTGSTGPYPIGYCAGWRDYTDQDYEEMKKKLGEHIVAEMKRDLEKREPFKEKYHFDGHATAEEAMECYDRYRLDHDLEFFEREDVQRKCAICEAWTTGMGSFRGEHFGEHWPLCKEHQTKENVEELLKGKRQKHRVGP